MRESRLSYFLEDEEGIFELEHFEISIEGTTDSAGAYTVNHFGNSLLIS